MNRFITVVLACLAGALIAAPEAAAQFDPGKQTTNIANQIAGIARRIRQYRTLTDQFIHLDCAARGMATDASATPAIGPPALCSALGELGAFQDAYAAIAGVPATLLKTVVPPRDWRAVLAAADTVSEADIRAVYAGGAGDRAATAYAARREAADRGVVLAHTRADAARELRAALDAAETAATDLEARSPVTATGLGQTRVAVTLTRAQLLAAIARHKAYESGVAAAGASASERARREMEARRLARRTALEAEWAADRAATAASRADRLESMYGGFRLHPLFGGNGQ